MILNSRKIGTSGLETAPLALGCNVFGWTVTESAAFEILDTFTSEGFNLLDTANVYSAWVPGNTGGESETIIGKWLRRRPGLRARVLIATKVGASTQTGGGGLTRDHILKEAETSLERLGTDYIDIYQSHLDDANTPLHETLDAYATLVHSGKIRTIGASNYSASRLAEALRTSAAGGYPRYESVEPCYNLYNREVFEGALETLCSEERLGVISYFSLANGFLTGKYRSGTDFLKSARGQFAQQAVDVREMFGARGQRILAALEGVSKEMGATPAQVSLAWLLAHGVTAPIASATTLEQLNELMRGVTLTLPQSALARLNQASA